MKRQIQIAIVISTILLFAVACNSYYSKAVSDIKQNTISSATVSNLEAAKTKKSKKIESYYELAKVYHYNKANENLEKARENYLFVYKSASSSEYKKNFESFSKKTGITTKGLKSSIKKVDDLMDYNNYMASVKLNTLKGYKDFLDKYMFSNHVTDAKNSAFKKACTLNTLKDYKKYLSYFPKHKTIDIKNKAYDKACKIAKFETYKQFLVDFSYHKKREIYKNAYNIVKNKNTIAEYNKYIATFRNSHLIEQAKTKRDLIIYDNFITSIKSKSTKEQLIEIDKFIKQSSGFKHFTKLTTYSKKILPTISTAEAFDEKYNLFGKYSYQTRKIETVIKDYFGANVYKCFAIDKTHYTYTYSDYQTVLEKRIAKYNSVLSKYYKISSSTKKDLKARKEKDNNYIKEKIINDEFEQIYRPLKAIVRNNSNYTDPEHRENTQKIRKLLNTSKYKTCANWSSVSSYFENAEVKKTCTKCSGTGKVAEQRCNRCKGRGEVRCDYCTTLSRDKQSDMWGSTTVSGLDVTVCCRAGKLQYENYNVTPSIHYDEFCPSCNGTSFKDCPICDGFGVIDKCSMCNSVGYKKLGYTVCSSDFFV